MLPVSTEQNKEIGASQPLATKTSLAPNGNVPENSATAARFISAVISLTFSPHKEDASYQHP